MIQSLILIEGNGVKKEDLTFSLSNAKQLVIGRNPGFGWIVHVAATSHADLGKALLAFAKISGVTAVTTLAIRT